MNPSSVKNRERGSCEENTLILSALRLATTTERPFHCGSASRAATNLASRSVTSFSASASLPSARPVSRVYSCHGAP